MQIPGNIPPYEPPRRRSDAARARPPAVDGDATPTAGSAAEAGDGVADRADVGLSQETIARFVAQIGTIAPERLHRVEELRKRIADGSYTASPDELAGPLADLLDGEAG